VLQGHWEGRDDDDHDGGGGGDDDVVRVYAYIRELHSLGIYTYDVATVYSTVSSAMR
jgi:hypothetical protein